VTSEDAVGATPAAGVDLARLHARLRALGTTVAVAESLTGGLLCAALTATAGASATVRGGLVVYATELKAELAGVDAGLLRRVGAVHEDVAAQLAAGARTRLAAGFGLGVTGVAGPEPQDGQPVGTVFAAVASAAGVRVDRYEFAGDRARIRRDAVQACLRLLEEECSDAR
jgi:nicotinamide-nucleotide amidase